MISNDEIVRLVFVNSNSELRTFRPRHSQLNPFSLDQFLLQHLCYLDLEGCYRREFESPLDTSECGDVGELAQDAVDLQELIHIHNLQALMVPKSDLRAKHEVAGLNSEGKSRCCVLLGGCGFGFGVSAHDSIVPDSLSSRNGSVFSRP